MRNYDEIFSESLKRIVTTTGYGLERFVDSFYERFLLSSSEVEDKFRGTDFEVQGRMLAESLLQMKVVVCELKANDRLEELAEFHSKRKLDIPPRLYDLWLECLIATARETDPEFTQNVELAWRMVMGSGIIFMKFRYEHPRLA